MARQTWMDKTLETAREMAVQMPWSRELRLQPIEAPRPAKVARTGS